MMTVNDYICVNACNKIRIVKRDFSDLAHVHEVLARVNYHQLDDKVIMWDDVITYNSSILLPEEITDMQVLNINIFDNETITLYVK